MDDVGLLAWQSAFCYALALSRGPRSVGLYRALIVARDVAILAVDSTQSTPADRAEALIVVFIAVKEEASNCRCSAGIVQCLGTAKSYAAAALDYIYQLTVMLGGEIEWW